MFTCNSCKENKPREDFYKNNKSTTGRVRQPCKDCTKGREKSKRQEYIDSEKNIPEYKVCSDCNTEKHNSEFHKRSDTPTGLRDRCKDCYNSSNRDYYKQNSEKVIERTSNYQKEHREDVSRRKRDRYWENPEHYREIDREYRRKNPDKVKESCKRYRERYPELTRERAKRYYHANKELIAEKAKLWRAKNKDKIAYYASKRRASIKNATPCWADQDIIKSFYTEAQYFNQSIDHIIPLTHPLVCGLHCEYNLQLMDLKENIAKNNNFEICEHELPEEIIYD